MSSIHRILRNRLGEARSILEFTTDTFESTNVITNSQERATIAIETRDFRCQPNHQQVKYARLVGAPRALAEATHGITLLARSSSNMRKNISSVSTAPWDP